MLEPTDQKKIDEAQKAIAGITYHKCCKDLMIIYTTKPLADPATLRRLTKAHINILKGLDPPILLDELHPPLANMAQSCIRWRREG